LVIWFSDFGFVSDFGFRISDLEPLMSAPLQDVRLLHYRPWRGQFRNAWWSVWPITRVALGTVMRRKLFWWLYGFSLLVFLMFFFGSYMLSWAETQIPQQPVQVQVGAQKQQFDTDRMLRLLRESIQVLSGNCDTFAYFFRYQGLMVMVVLSLAGSMLVGNDITHGSLPFYLAKPLSRWHYILGKCLAVAVVVNLLTTVPALALYVQHGLDDMDYFIDPDFFWKNRGIGNASWPLLLGVLGYGAVMTVTLSLLLVATATWVRRTMPIVMVWTTLFLFLHLFSAMLVDGFHFDARWRLVDLWNDIGLVGCAFLGLGSAFNPLPPALMPPPQPALAEAAGVLLGVCLVCLIYLNRRTRAVEIVK
jgi:ABC-2 type transport system permease protein